MNKRIASINNIGPVLASQKLVAIESSELNAGKLRFYIFVEPAGRLLKETQLASFSL